MRYTDGRLANKLIRLIIIIIDDRNPEIRCFTYVRRTPVVSFNRKI